MGYLFIELNSVKILMRDIDKLNQDVKHYKQHIKYLSK